MRVAEILGRVAGVGVRWPRWVIGACLVLAVGGAVAATRLQPAAGTDTLVDRDTGVFRATEGFKRAFGDDAVVILVRGSLQRLMLTSDLARLVSLEGCLSGNVPKGAQPPPGPCEDIADLHPARVVFGPGTFVNEAASQVAAQFDASQRQLVIQAQAAQKAAIRAARRQGLPPAQQQAQGKGAAEQVRQQFLNDLLTAAVRYGLSPNTRPSLDSPDFVNRLVFDSRQTSGTPKARFSYLFPNRSSALISIRLRPSLSDSKRDKAIDLFRQAIEDPAYRLHGGDYVLSGVPVVVSSLAEVLRGALILLLIVGIAIMAATLAVGFRARARLLPLGIGLGAAAVTFGAFSLTGGELTMAQVAVMPILIGLAVDYAIQFQARLSEALDAGLAPGAAATQAARTGGPVIATAVAATIAGFVALLLSPVPMVREFGLMLVVGVVLAFGLALLVASAVAVLYTPGPRRAVPGGRLSIAANRLASAVGGPAGRAGQRLGTAFRNALGTAITEPRRVLAVAVALAAVGWVAGTQSQVVSDIRDLVPSDLAAIRDVNRLQDVTGVSGEINVAVRSTGKADLARPRVVDWMERLRTRVLDRNGFAGRFPRCEQARVCPSAALTDLFRNPAGRQTSRRVHSLLAAVPPYFSQAVITKDRRTANVSFGIRVGPLDRQQQVIDSIRDSIRRQPPPRGVSASVAGLPVLAAEANADLSSSRYWLTLGGLLAVALVLLGAMRAPRRVAVVLLPIVLATGWSALVLAAMDVPLNPMSATLGALVIAIATEFSVLLAARFEEERGGGRSVGEALRRTYERTGAAVLASAATTIAGFAVLLVSDITMLRDFGFATVVDLSVALIGVMLVLPAALVVADERATRAEDAVPSTAVPGEHGRLAAAGR